MRALAFPEISGRYFTFLDFDFIGNRKLYINIDNGRYSPVNSKWKHVLTLRG